MVTIGQGATDKITSDLSKLGSNMLIARPGTPTPGPPSGSEARTFTERDVEALRSVAECQGCSGNREQECEGCV